MRHFQKVAAQNGVALAGSERQFGQAHARASVGAAQNFAGKLDQILKPTVSVTNEHGHTAQFAHRHTLLRSHADDSIAGRLDGFKHLGKVIDARSQDGERVRGENRAAVQIAAHQGEGGDDALGLPARHHDAGKFSIVADDEDRIACAPTADCAWLFLLRTPISGTRCRLFAHILLVLFRFSYLRGFTASSISANRRLWVAARFTAESISLACLAEAMRAWILPDSSCAILITCGRSNGISPLLRRSICAAMTARAATARCRVSVVSSAFCRNAPTSQEESINLTPPRGILATEPALT